LTKAQWEAVKTWEQTHPWGQVHVLIFDEVQGLNPFEEYQERV
jgi:hypothetical protein